MLPPLGRKVGCCATLAFSLSSEMYGLRVKDGCFTKMDKSREKYGPTLVSVTYSDYH